MAKLLESRAKARYYAWATSHAESPPTLEEDDDEVFQNAGATVRL